MTTVPRIPSFWLVALRAVRRWRSGCCRAHPAAVRRRLRHRLFPRSRWSTGSSAARAAHARRGSWCCCCSSCCSSWSSCWWCRSSRLEVAELVAPRAERCSQDGAPARSRRSSQMAQERLSPEDVAKLRGHGGRARRTAFGCARHMFIERLLTQRRGARQSAVARLRDAGRVVLPAARLGPASSRASTSWLPRRQVDTIREQAPPHRRARSSAFVRGQVHGLRWSSRVYYAIGAVARWGSISASSSGSCRHPVLHPVRRRRDRLHPGDGARR